MSSSEDEDMGFYSDDGPYSSSFYYRYSLGSRAKTPPRSDPILSYDVKYVEGQSSIGKTMYVYPIIHDVANFSDLAFVLDCTGSMQRYINATRDHVIGICDMIRGEQGLNGPDDLRVAVCQLLPPVVMS